MVNQHVCSALGPKTRKEKPFDLKPFHNGRRKWKREHKLTLSTSGLC